MNVNSIKSKIKESSLFFLEDPHLYEEHEESDEHEQIIQSFFKIMELKNLTRLKVHNFFNPDDEYNDCIYMLRQGDCYTFSELECVDAVETSFKVNHEKRLRDQAEKLKKEKQEICTRLLN